MKHLSQQLIICAGVLCACQASQQPVCPACELVFVDGGYPTSSEEQMARVWIASPSLIDVEVEEVAFTSTSKYCWPDPQQAMRLAANKRLEIYDIAAGQLHPRELDLRWEAPENDSALCREAVASRAFVVSYADDGSEYFRANMRCQNENSITFEDRNGPGADAIAVSHWSPGKCEGLD